MQHGSYFRFFKQQGWHGDVHTEHWPVRFEDNHDLRFLAIYGFPMATCLKTRMEQRSPAGGAEEWRVYWLSGQTSKDVRKLA